MIVVTIVTLMMKKMIRVYTDGTYYHKRDKCGAWGAVVFNGNASKIIGGYEKDTTNNRMEMMGPIHAMKGLSYFPDEILIRSDSEYVVNSFNSYLARWAKNGWLGVNKQPIKNDDLWKEMHRLKLMMQGRVRMKWVKGHSGSLPNRIADQICIYCFENKNQININFDSEKELEGQYERHIGIARR